MVTLAVFLCTFVCVWVILNIEMNEELVKVSNENIPYKHIHPYMTLHPYRGRAEGAGACPSHICTKAGTPLNELPAHLCEYYGVRYLACGYLSGALTVSWYLHLLPQQLNSLSSHCPFSTIPPLWICLKIYLV